MSRIEIHIDTNEELNDDSFIDIIVNGEVVNHYHLDMLVDDNEEQFGELFASVPIGIVRNTDGSYSRQ